MTGPVLKTVGLEKRFGDFAAVSGVDLRVERGELRGLIGPNGAGKTTLFDLVSGELAPTAGRVHFLGDDVTGVPAHLRARRGMARALQVASLFPSLSVEETLLGAIYGGRRVLDPVSSYRADEAGRERVGALVDRVGLDVSPAARVGTLAHPDRKLLEVAIALAGDPALLLLDEPTAGLSAGETAEMRALVDDLAGEVTVLLVEHDMDVVMAVADAVTVLHRGEVIADGTPGAIRDDERVRDVYFGRGA